MGDPGKVSEEELHAYITDNIDRAIKEGWITVFYQPVVRTLTGEVCGVEALARWRDPVYGLLNPEVFITALEKARLIHKLDCHIIRRVCRDYKESVDAGLLVEPASFNLSRLDFQLCDIHDVIEEAVHRYKVPRDALHVEITESMMEKNERRMHRVIDRFVDFGLKVWMDDFGSGYSSLNVLKDFDFETIKIDMVFLKNFDVRSREIIRSVVDMAKRIGVHTLAEGVETEEQYAFLRNIGCEKAQGYLFSQPLPLEELRKKLIERGYHHELAAKARYYHDVGRINVLSPTPFQAGAHDEDKKEDFREGQYPLAIIEYRDEDRSIRYLYYNDNYRAVMLHLGFPDSADVEKEFARNHSAIGDRLLAMMKASRESRKRRTIDFFIGKNRCYGIVQWISDYHGGSAYLTTLQNLTDDQIVVKTGELTDYLQSLCMMYERITLIDLNTGRSRNLYEVNKTREVYNQGPIADEVSDFAENEIYPEDRETFAEFLDFDTLERRISESTWHFLSVALRTRTRDNTYAWMSLVAMFAGDPADRNILVCCRRIADTSVQRLRRNIEGMIQAQNAENGGLTDPRWGFPAEVIWESFTNASDTAFFWKDSERRYLGANRFFMEYYGLRSVNEIRGKTDEEIGWTIDPVQSRKEEEKILSDGISVSLSPDSRICKGEVRNILASKFPLYQDGKIVGLIGYLLDTTFLKDIGLEASLIRRNDAITGALGLVGVVESVLRYQDAFVFDNKDFAMIMFDINHFHIFTREYGKEWCHTLLRVLSEKIRAILGSDTVFGRLSADRFLLVRQISGQQEVDEIIDRVARTAEMIHEVDGIPCTIYLMYGYSLYSEIRDLQAMLGDAEKMLADNKKQRDQTD